MSATVNRVVICTNGASQSSLYRATETADGIVTLGRFIADKVSAEDAPVIARAILSTQEVQS